MSMNAEITNNNIEQFLAREGSLKRYFYAPCYGRRRGWASAFGFPDRTYHEEIYLDEDCGLVYMELSFDLACPKEYRAVLSEYLTILNARFKTGDIRMDENGHIYGHSAQYFKDAPISEGIIAEMERDLIAFGERFGSKLQRVASGGEIPSKEEEVKEIIEQMMRPRLEHDS